MLSMYIKDTINRLFLSSESSIKSKLLRETETEQDYYAELLIGNFVIKFEKYFREMYATLLNKNDLNNEINLYNLLEYLYRDSSITVKSQYFQNENSIQESIKKQIEHIYKLLLQNFESINSFYNDNKYHGNLLEFDKYWRVKHPEFYNSK